MLTFVVYYRIHLNLNLEASARQWPNCSSHPFTGTSHPQTTQTCELFVALGSDLCDEHDKQDNGLGLVIRLTFIEHF